MNRNRWTAKLGIQ